MIYTLIGIPGSGKSTFAANHPECKTVSSDAIRKELYGDESFQGDGKVVFQIVQDRIRQYNDENFDVIFDACNISPWARSGVLRIKAKHTAVVFRTPVDVCKKRNRERSRKVPEDVIDRMARRFVYPTKKEGFDEIVEISD